MLDQGEGQKPREVLSTKRLHLMFHNSGMGEEALEGMRRFGLLSHSPTLTPRLDVASYYSGGNFLTFWYPERGDVAEGRQEDRHTPTHIVTEEMRREMLDALDKMDLHFFFKDGQRAVINQAETYLPGSRLRAVARLRYTGTLNLELLLPEDHTQFISLYTEKGDELTKEVREEIEPIDIQFLDPSLNKDILAEDIVRSYVEHHLSAMGAYMGDDKNALESNLKILENGSFNDPVYERYRSILASRINQKLATLQ